MTTRIVLLVVFGLLISAPARAAVGPEARGWDENDRALAASDKPGSLARPHVLSPDQLKSLCRDLTPPPPESDAPEPQAARRVFAVTVPTARLQWEATDNAIQLNRQRPVVALDGWLRLQVLVSGPARFKARGEALQQLKERLRAPETTLDVVFVVDDAREINPCFAITGSESYTMAIIPLVWTLRAGTNELATVRAPAYERFAQWARPGAAKLRLRATAEPGVVNTKALNSAVRRARSSFKRCAMDVMSTEAGTVVVGLSAVLTTDGRLVNVRTELTSDDKLGSCFARVLRDRVNPPRPSRTSAINVVVQVSRGG